MPDYYWELDFSEDRDKYPAEWIGQNIEVSDDGVLIYEADKCTDRSWQDAYGCAGTTTSLWTGCGPRP